MSLYRLGILLVHISYWVALISVIVIVIRNRNPEYILLLVLLTIIVLLENSIVLRLIQARDVATSINLAIIIEIILYLLIYYTLLKTELFRQIILVALVTFLAAVLFNSFYFQSITGGIQSFSYLVGNLFILMCIYFFFYETISNLQLKDSFLNNFWVWISFGLFLFLITETPIMVFHGFAQEHFVEINDPYIYSIKHAASIIYYSLFPIAALCKKTLN